jgi:hypothetical protein
LKRPISPSNSSYKTAKKRYQLYPKTEFVGKTLAKSNSKMKLYCEKLVTSNHDTIIDNLEKEGLFPRSTTGCS